MFNSRSACFALNIREKPNTISHLVASQSRFTVPDMWRSLFGEVVENMKVTEPGRHPLAG